MDAIDIGKLGTSLRDRNTWLILLLAAGFGILGGFAHKLGSAADDTGSVAGLILVGAASALAALLVINPSDGVRLVALSVIAGYGGKAFLDATEARAKVLISSAEAVKAKNEARQAIQIGKEAVGIASKLTKTQAALERALMEKSSAKNREEVLGPIQRSLPRDLASFAGGSPEQREAELERLSKRLQEMQQSLPQSQ